MERFPLPSLMEILFYSQNYISQSIAGVFSPRQVKWVVIREVALSGGESHTGSPEENATVSPPS